MHLFIWCPKKEKRPTLRVLPRISKITYLGYWQRLLPNFTPVGEVLERTVTEQKTE